MVENKCWNLNFQNIVAKLPFFKTLYREKVPQLSIEQKTTELAELADCQLTVL